MLVLRSAIPGDIYPRAGCGLVYVNTLGHQEINLMSDAGWRPPVVVSGTSKGMQGDR